MNNETERAACSGPVAPLRKRRGDGQPYTRPAEIEARIAALSRFSTPELVEQVRIDDPSDPRYVPSECVLYFVRRPASLDDEGALLALFTVLRQRALAAVPVPDRRVPGSSKKAQNAADLEIRDAVLHKFQELLCRDRTAYEEHLDYYECRFNSALASLRATARRGVRREASRHEPLESECEPNAPTAEVESALAAIGNSSPCDDFLFRSKLLVAISSLPPNERRVVELYLDGVPIDSKEEGVTTMVNVLNCSEKTVRNRRDRAFAKLRDALKEEDS